MVTKEGIGLNATKESIPTQGRVSTGVHGIALREGDEVVFMQQINEDGEIIIATDEGRFKRVISALVEPKKRNNKGTTIVGLKDGAKVISASYVTKPYMLAVVEKGGVVSELSSEDIMIQSPSNRAQRVMKYKEGTVLQVIPLPYKKGE